MLGLYDAWCGEKANSSTRLSQVIDLSGKCFSNFSFVCFVSIIAYKCCPGVLPVDSCTNISTPPLTKLLWYSPVTAPVIPLDVKLPISGTEHALSEVNSNIENNIFFILVYTSELVRNKFAVFLVGV